MTWIFEHLDDILAIYGALVAVCTVIVKCTKTDKDDKILNKVVKFADLFSTVFTKEDAAKLAAATKKSNK